MNPVSSSSEVFSFKVFSDRTSLISVQGQGEKRVTMTDGLRFLKRSVPMLESALPGVGDEQEECLKSLSFGQHLVSMTTQADGTRNVLLFRPEGRAMSRVEVNYSGGSALDIYSSVFQVLITEFGMEAFNAFMFLNFGGSFEPEKRVFIFPSVMYPNILCSFSMKKLADKEYGIGHSPYYYATKSRLPSVWMSGSTAKVDQIPDKFHMPFTNFFDNNRMCFGSIPMVDKFTDSGNYRPLDWFIDVLFSSNYNMDLLGYAMSNRSLEKVRETKIFTQALIKAFPTKETFINRAISGSSGVKSYFEYLDWIAYLAAPTTNFFPYELYV